MGRVHTKPDGNVAFTKEEEAIRDAEEAAVAAAASLEQWKTEIAEAGISRDLENVIDVLTDTQLDSLDSFTRDKYAAKKALRARQPDA